MDCRLVYIIFNALISSLLKAACTARLTNLSLEALHMFHCNWLIDYLLIILLYWILHNLDQGGFVHLKKRLLIVRRHRRLAKHL